MNLAVEVAADKTAAGDQGHAQQGDIAVKSAQMETAMKQNAHRADDTQDHMAAEPPFDRSEALHEACALTQRIKQQQQHEYTADDAQRITYPALGSAAQIIAVYPAPIEGYQDAAEEQYRAELLEA